MFQPMEVAGQFRSEPALDTGGSAQISPQLTFKPDHQEAVLAIQILDWPVCSCRTEIRAISLLHLAVAWLGACLAPWPSLAAEPLPRSILVLEQSDVRGPFYGAIYSGLQSEVNASATSPVSIYVENARAQPLPRPRI